MSDNRHHHLRWHLTIHGLLSVVFATAVLMWANMTPRVLVLLIGAYFLGGLITPLVHFYAPTPAGENPS